MHNVSCTLVPANEKVMLNEMVMKESRALREVGGSNIITTSLEILVE